MMPSLINAFMVLLLLAQAHPAQAQLQQTHLLQTDPARTEDAILADLFEKTGVSGTLLITSVRSGRSMVHDESRAARLFPVASTFKIFNTLIALEEGVIEHADSPIPWDGQHHEFESWNRDQTLESAFKVSCVWCYKDLARRIGMDKYSDYLQKTGYGQLQQPFKLTEFWLDGSLRISAKDQVEFLRQVVERRLPFRQSSYDTLKRVMDSSGEAPGLHAKTGWAIRNSPQIGWYVGYLETSDDVWLFALNMDIRTPSDLPLRQRLVQDALARKGLLTQRPSEKK
jgi:beta-lactamase class D